MCGHQQCRYRRHFYATHRRTYVPPPPSTLLIIIIIIIIIPWSSGKALCWDVRVTCPQAESYISAAARQSGAAAEIAASRKEEKRSTLILMVGIFLNRSPLTHWARVHQNRRSPATLPDLPSCQISSSCVNPHQRYPLQKNLRTCGQKQTVNDIPQHAYEHVGITNVAMVRPMFCLYVFLSFL